LTNFEKRLKMESNIAVKRRRVESTEDGVEKDKEFTDAEAALYDRQIRLWGVEAQKRLNNANILVIGLSGLGAEMSKNIILGGVKSVTLMDHQNVTELDASSQFLVSRNSVGQNRAEASQAKAQLLNPMVKVVADSSRPDDKDEEFFKDFTIICAIGCKKSQICRLNDIARGHGIKFFAADVFGFMGYIFSDLGEEHNFTRDIVVNATKARPETTRTLQGKAVFPPFQDVANVDWNVVLKSQKKINPSTFAMFVLLEFLEKNERPPQPGSLNDDYKKLKELRDEYLVQHKLELEQIPDEMFSNVYGQLGPVCAITGGVLAQEIVKAISHRDAPIINFFVCNPELSTSVVENIYGKITCSS